MKNNLTLNNGHGLLRYKDSLQLEEVSHQALLSPKGSGFQALPPVKTNSLPEILCITSYPPRECGLATYSHDLIQALKDKFGSSFRTSVCALESDHEKHRYPEEVKYKLNTSDPESYVELAKAINRNPDIETIMIQHEFGFFNKQEESFNRFLCALIKPVVVVFHTVLPRPDEAFKKHVQGIAEVAASVVVMTRNSERLLVNDYRIPNKKISVIPHGTHLVPFLDRNSLKEKYGLTAKRVLSTFGLLSSGKSIETALKALPSIVQANPDVVFLIIGKTHPSVVKHEGEKYRALLERMTVELGLSNNVRFINSYQALPELLEYLQLTDIYLFTSKDPNQAVSGTFSYALSCGCPIISTPIPHAKELLGEDAGIFVEFENPQQLSVSVNRLLGDETLRAHLGLNGLHRIASTVWENAAIAHAFLFREISGTRTSLKYNLPAVNLDHLKKMTTDFGMLQFSNINTPDPASGYTLDDNARALVAMCQHYELTGDRQSVKYIETYLNFIKYCLQPEGYFLNYVNDKGIFTEQNNGTNLADANGRAIWALGYVVSLDSLLPEEFTAGARGILQKVVPHINSIYSTRAMAFVIKGLYYANKQKGSNENLSLIAALANRLVQMFRHESDKDWRWFESYLTYANGILPEAMLCAYAATGELTYRQIAKESFDFLLTNTFKGDMIKVISNKSWLHKGEAAAHYGEQPIDVAYTILALGRFYDEFKEEDYLSKMRNAFNWFQGNNHLHRIIYNPCTGGCYDGLEEDHVNLNQGAESTVSYLMARLTVEKYSNGKSIKLTDETYAKSTMQGQVA